MVKEIVGQGILAAGFMYPLCLISSLSLLYSCWVLLCHSPSGVEVPEMEFRETINLKTPPGEGPIYSL